MTKILLIRHALTDSVGKRLSGRSPGLSLNEQGKQQALELSDKLANMEIATVFCSPLERAIETAGPIAEALGIPFTISDDFLEIDFGKWTNRTIEELRSDAQFRNFNIFRSGTRVPGGETMLEAQMRIVHGLQKIKALYPEKMVAVVTHADIIKAAIIYFAGMHLDMYSRIEISPASVSMIEIHDDTARILLLNETCQRFGCSGK